MFHSVTVEELFTSLDALQMNSVCFQDGHRCNTQRREPQRVLTQDSAERPREGPARRPLRARGGLYRARAPGARPLRGDPGGAASRPVLVCRSGRDLRGLREQEGRKHALLVFAQRLRAASSRGPGPCDNARTSQTLLERVPGPGHTCGVPSPSQRAHPALTVQSPPQLSPESR